MQTCYESTLCLFHVLGLSLPMLIVDRSETWFLSHTLVLNQCFTLLMAENDLSHFAEANNSK